MLLTRFTWEPLKNQRVSTRNSSTTPLDNKNYNCALDNKKNRNVTIIKNQRKYTSIFF